MWCWLVCMCVTQTIFLSILMLVAIRLASSQSVAFHSESFHNGRRPWDQKLGSCHGGSWMTPTRMWGMHSNFHLPHHKWSLIPGKPFERGGAEQIRCVPNFVLYSFTICRKPMETLYMYIWFMCTCVHVGSKTIIVSCKLVNQSRCRMCDEICRSISAGSFGAQLMVSGSAVPGLFYDPTW